MRSESAQDRRSIGGMQDGAAQSRRSSRLDFPDAIDAALFFRLSRPGVASFFWLSRLSRLGVASFFWLSRLGVVFRSRLFALFADFDRFVASPRSRQLDLFCFRFTASNDHLPGNVRVPFNSVARFIGISNVIHLLPRRSCSSRIRRRRRRFPARRPWPK